MRSEYNIARICSPLTTMIMRGRSLDSSESARAISEQQLERHILNLILIVTILPNNWSMFVIILFFLIHCFPVKISIKMIFSAIEYIDVLLLFKGIIK
jgi:hypothetical protein